MPDDQPLDSALDWVAEHTRRYVASGGTERLDWEGMPCLVLTTVGRTSGRQRRNAVGYGRDGDDLVVVASKGGSPRNPLWYLNLVAEPRVTVQVGPEVFDAVARTVDDPAERARLWAVMSATWPAFDDYQARTDRVIPVVRISRAG